MLDQAMVSKLRRLMEAREERDSTALAAKRAEKEYRELESEVWDTLEESAMKPPFKIDLGGDIGEVGFHPRETYYGRVLDADKALDYFEARAMTDEFTQPKITMARVNELVREAIEQQTGMPPGIDFYPKRFVTITRKKG